MATGVSTGGGGRPQALREAVAQGGLALAGAVKDAALDGAKAWCVESPRRCLDDAAQLTALVAANQTEDLSEPADLSIPLPVPPRRRATPRS